MTTQVISPPDCVSSVLAAVYLVVAPRFARASAAVDAPVPPWATATSVAAQVPVAIVPTVVIVD